MIKLFRSTGLVAISLLAAALASGAALAQQKVLKFIPQADLRILDPIATTAYITRNHGYMVYDTLYGQAGQKDGFKAMPQMLAGHTVESDGRTWKLTLRDGLLFHDGERVHVAFSMLRRVGMNVDYQATDWGTLVQRRALTKPPAEGGWNLFCTWFSGLDWFSPASHLALRGNGKSAWFGWPENRRIEELREAWFNAPDLATQKKIGAQMQLKAFEDVPYYPLGLAQFPTALRQDITGVSEGFAIFWNVRRV